jgi:hypothetical protein
MDSAHFDTIVKTHACTRSRRQVLWALAGATGIGVLARWGGPDAALAAPPIHTAKCSHNGKPCDIGCCKGLACDPEQGICVRPRKIKPA